MNQRPEVELGELLTQANRFEAVSEGSAYPLLGVRLEGKGAFLRETVTETETAAKRFNSVKQGDFIYSRLYAWRGAFALIPPSLDGCFVSNEFPVFVVDANRICASYLRYWFRLPSIWRRVEEDCSGSTPTTRNRYKEQFFLALKVPLPPLREQQAIVSRLDALAGKVRQVNELLDAIERDADRLLRAHIFSPNVEKIVRKPMSELLTLRQPDIRVDPLSRYNFAGVYSFGRGVFASISKDGSEFAYDRLTTIYTGDFTYPKLMAWEGALGVVPLECDGLVVSPEFPVFTVNTDAVLPEVLDIYFRTPEVWPQIAEISGGTNVRRRRVQPAKFLNYHMPVPSMRTQLKVRDIYRHIHALKARHATVRQANDALIPATLESVFA